MLSVGAERRSRSTRLLLNLMALTSLPRALQAELQQLSRREREVLRLLLANHRPQTIAKKLFISLHTVRNHLRSIFEKLAVHSQTELLTRLGRHGTYSD